MQRYASYFFVLSTILLTVYGQLIIKHRIGRFGSLPADFTDKVKFFVAVFMDPLILSGFFAAFLASLAWMAAMTKLDLSHAYPFMSINFLLVLLLSTVFFGESFTTQKLMGVLLIMAGTVVAVRG